MVFTKIAVVADDSPKARAALKEIEKRYHVVELSRRRTGAQAVAGSLVSVNYTGKLENGTVFDTSVGKAPIQFPLGQGYVIKGWEQGLLGMKVGGKRLLIIPPDMAYGDKATGPIPANSTLLFEVELVGVK